MDGLALDLVYENGGWPGPPPGATDGSVRTSRPTSAPSRRSRERLTGTTPPAVLEVRGEVFFAVPEDFAR